MFCRMLQGKHSAILSTFIKLPFVAKTFGLSIFEWLFNTGFTEDEGWSKFRSLDQLDSCVNRIKMTTHM